MAESTRFSMGEIGSLESHAAVAEGEESEDDVFKDGIGESLANALECPVCMEYMIPPICLCESGHSICSICRPQLDLCPSCRKPFMSTRNVALESLTAALEYPCRNDGCPESFPLDLVTQHQKVCPYRPYDCPLALRIEPDKPCTWKGPRSAVRNHVLEAHKRYVRIGWESTSILRGIMSQVNYSLIIFAYDEVFLQRSGLKNGKFCSTVQLIGPKEEAMKYRYEFLMSSDDGSQKVIIGNLTHGCTEDLQQVFKTGKCVRLDFETIENFMYDNKLPYKLRIFSSQPKSKTPRTSPLKPLNSNC